MALRNWVVFMALAVLMPVAGHPCPPSRPRTWDLIDRAELITLGRVVQVRTEDPPPEPVPDEEGLFALPVFPGGVTQVELELLETWKGSGERSITLHASAFMDGMHGVERGDTLLVFLRRWEGNWSLAGYEGYEKLAEADVADWRELVKRAVEVQSQPRPRKEDVRDWHIHAALHPPNRREGLTFLFNAPERPMGLSREQQQRLAASYLADQGIAWDMSLVLRALEGHPDSDVDLLVSVLLDEALVKYQDHPYAMSELQDTLELLEARTGAKGPGTERCHMKDSYSDEAFTACVRARWERIRPRNAR